MAGFAVGFLALLAAVRVEQEYELVLDHSTVLAVLVPERARVAAEHRLVRLEVGDLVRHHETWSQLIGPWWGYLALIQHHVLIPLMLSGVYVRPGSVRLVVDRSHPLHSGSCREVSRIIVWRCDHVLLIVRSARELGSSAYNWLCRGRLCGCHDRLILIKGLGGGRGALRNGASLMVHPPIHVVEALGRHIRVGNRGLAVHLETVELVTTVTHGIHPRTHGARVEFSTTIFGGFEFLSLMRRYIGGKGVRLGAHFAWSNDMVFSRCSHPATGCSNLC